MKKKEILNVNVTLEETDGKEFSESKSPAPVLLSSPSSFEDITVAKFELSLSSPPLLPLLPLLLHDVLINNSPNFLHEIRFNFLDIPP